MIIDSAYKLSELKSCYQRLKVLIESYRARFTLSEEQKSACRRRDVIVSVFLSMIVVTILVAVLRVYGNSIHRMIISSLSMFILFTVSFLCFFYDNLSKGMLKKRLDRHSVELHDLNVFIRDSEYLADAYRLICDGYKIKNILRNCNDVIKVYTGKALELYVRKGEGKYKKYRFSFKKFDNIITVDVINYSLIDAKLDEIVGNTNYFYDSLKEKGRYEKI